MRETISREFLDTYKQAFDQYVNGDWSNAKTTFEKVLELRAGDGPSKRIVEFMEENNYTPPANW